MLGSPAILTVGIPVFNAMPFLPEAMESLFRQTIGGFEILIIVDGATDGSLRYLRSLHHPHLRVLEQPNAGVTATLNRILRETRTPWLVRQDADDVSYPARMETLLAAVQNHREAGLIYSLADYHPREKCAGQFRCSRGTPEQLRAIVDSGYLLSMSLHRSPERREGNRRRRLSHGSPRRGRGPVVAHGAPVSHTFHSGSPDRLPHE